MTTFTNKELYYDIKKSHPHLYIGIGRPKDIIKKYNIPSDKYVFAYYSKKTKQYMIPNGEYNKAIIFILKDYVDNKLPANTNSSKIILNDNEKFNIDGNIHEVDIRGERVFNKIFFRVRDIGKMIGVKDIRSVFHKSSKYKKDIDYKSIKIKRKGDIVSRYFFTYVGLISYIFSTRSKDAGIIQEQLMKILYIHQFGDKQEKKILGAELLGVSLDHLKNVLNASDNVSCIYLFALGKVVDLRKSMNINSKYLDDDIVCKYGFTKNLKDRTKKHQKKYSKIKGANLALKYYRYIDSGLLSKAETKISHYFEATYAKLKYSTSKELVVVSTKHIDNIIKEQYDSIARSYCIENKAHIQKLLDLENMYEKKLLQKDIIMKEQELNKHKELSIKDKELSIKDKELEKERTKSLLLEKDIELLKKDSSLQKALYEIELLKK